MSTTITTTTTSAEPLAVKVRMEESDELRRSTIASPTTLSGLTASIQRMFPALKDSSVRITYLDEDGEWVLIGSDAEVLEAVRISTSPLRLRVKATGPVVAAKAAIDLAVARSALAAEGLDTVVGDMRLAKLWLNNDSDVAALVKAVRHIKTKRESKKRDTTPERTAAPAAPAVKTDMAPAPAPIAEEVLGTVESKSDSPDTLAMPELATVKAALADADLADVVKDGRLRGIIGRFHGDVDMVKTEVATIAMKRKIDITPALTALSAAGLESVIGDARLRSVWLRHDGDISAIVEAVRTIQSKKATRAANKAMAPATAEMEAGAALELATVKAALADADLADVVKDGRLKGIIARFHGDVDKVKTEVATIAMKRKIDITPALTALSEAGLESVIGDARLRSVWLRHDGDISAIVDAVRFIQTKKAGRKAGLQAKAARKAVRKAARKAAVPIDLDAIKAALVSEGLVDIVKDVRLRNIARRQKGMTGAERVNAVVSVVRGILDKRTAMDLVDLSAVNDALTAAGVATDAVPRSRLVRLYTRLSGDVGAVVRRVQGIVSKAASRAVRPEEAAARLAQRFASEMAVFDSRSADLAAFRPRVKVLKLMNSYDGDVDSVVQKVTELMARRG